MYISYGKKEGTHELMNLEVIFFLSFVMLIDILNHLQGSSMV